ncbi:FAD binding domain-containing protein [Talaromyces proteolyticus]|uniref:FAD binding domain-containing protein n=1 Tax=Talaromyces proteolyticus TaxID=1131652 RepID=A0AAD4L2F3_9EURO|nr:FAD binding domain-containing protein [Talaromyces proteolyticus]KAH8704707.1 FAD binding domain-containing protein [Talaromyces proteolyticus]
MTTEKNGFRVIVAGGGIAGLAMSHALQLANIDHVVLEAYGDVRSHVGASIGLWPNGIRVLEQMGCWKDIKNHCAPMVDSYNRLPDGRAISVSRLADMIKVRHGYDFVVLERQLVVSSLYDNLPDKSRILVNKRVSGVTETEDGVEVHTEDGAKYEGDIVVGCDGVNSTVRDIMWANANRAIPGYISAAEKRSLATTYACLIGFAPDMPGMSCGDCHTVHNQGFSFLVITQPGRTFFFVFIKLPKVIHWPDRPRFTAEDAEKEAAKLSNLPISDTVLFGELWQKRIRGQLIALEEVVFDHWHFGRIAILGDSAHKLTINLAFGGNSALESTAALVNKLNRELKANPNQKMSKETLSRIFEEYQELRKPRMKKVLNLAYQLTRLQAWDGWFMKFVQRFVIPWVGDERVADHFADLVKGGIKLDYVPLPNQPLGTVAWDDDPKKEASLPVSKKSSSLGLWALGLILSLNASYYLVSLLRSQYAVQPV